jgi:uncharacterized protein (TIGR00730 family)
MTARVHVCVFCGSNVGHDPRYAEAARALGTTLAQEGLGLVYGGGKVGLMGIVADATLAAGGTVIGVIPRSLSHEEIEHRGLTSLHVVGSMHERKAMMSDLADGGYIALPGGLGTFEELFEVWTWAQLGHHPKPVGMLNVGGFYDPLLAFLDTTVTGGFVKPQHRAILVVDTEPRSLLARLRGYVPPPRPPWSGVPTP